MNLSLQRTRLLRILRRLWIVALCMVVAGATASLLSAGPPSYTVQAVLLVPGGGDPVGASEAQRLAATYAAVLAQDDGVTPVVAAAVGRTRSEVEERLGIANVSGTSAVQVTYEGETPREAVRAVRTVVRVVTGDTPQTPTVSPGTLVPTRAAGEPEPASRPPAVPIGLLLGFALGVLLVFTLERAEPRVDDAADLETVLPAPATLLKPTPDSVGALAERWAHRTDGYDTVAIAPLSDRDAPAAARVYEALRRHVKARGHSDGGSASLPPFDATAARVFLESKPVVGPLEGLMPAGRCTAMVLVVTQGTRARTVRRATRELGAMDVRLLWCVVVPPPSRRWRPGGHQDRDWKAVPEADARPVTSVRALASGDRTGPP